MRGGKRKGRKGEGKGRERRDVDTPRFLPGSTPMRPLPWYNCSSMNFNTPFCIGLGLCYTGVLSHGAGCREDFRDIISKLFNIYSAPYDSQGLTDARQWWTLAKQTLLTYCGVRATSRTRNTLFTELCDIVLLTVIDQYYELY